MLGIAQPPYDWAAAQGAPVMIASRKDAQRTWPPRHRHWHVPAHGGWGYNLREARLVQADHASYWGLTLDQVTIERCDIDHSRRFPEKYAARPMTENEDTCERCGYIRDCYSTASNGCTTCGWERGYHEGATME